MLIRISKAPYSSSDCTEIIGITMRRLNSLIERGHIRASLEEGTGPGSRRQWSYDDLIRIIAIERMTSFLTADVIRQLAEFMSDPENIQPDRVLYIQPEIAIDPIVLTTESSLNPLGDLPAQKFNQASMGVVISFRQITSFLEHRLEI